MAEKEILKVLSEFRWNKLSLDELSTWVSSNEGAANQVLTRSEYLALKHGRLPNVYQIGANKLKPCNGCINLIEKQMVPGISEYWSYHDELKSKVTLKEFNEIKRPYWYLVPKNRPGQDSYHQCNRCGSIWALFMPDQAVKGGFVRVM